jgi:hypothetical protein
LVCYNYFEICEHPPLCRIIYGFLPEEILEMLDVGFRTKMNEPMNIRFEYTEKENSERRRRAHKLSDENRFLLWLLQNR